MQAVDWGCPDALAAALAARPGARVLLPAGAGERALDALALGAGEVVACAGHVAERAMLDLRARALECLPRAQAWAMLGAGRAPGPAETVALLSLRMAPASARFWRRNAYVLTHLFRHGRAGWLMWALDAALRAAGAGPAVDWARARWRVHALLYFAFTACPVSPALALGSGRGPGSWYEYAVARAEAAYSRPAAERAPQMAVVRAGAYDADNPPPHLRAGTRLPLERLAIADVALDVALDTPALGRFDVIALWGRAEAWPTDDDEDVAHMARVARALAPDGVAIVASVQETPDALLARFRAVGLGAARRAPCRPGAFASHWLVGREGN